MKNESAPVFVGDSQVWAEQQFGECDLGDVRRTRRVVEYAARQAEQPSASTNAACGGDDAAAEGAYRMIRNSRIEPAALEKGPFEWTARRCVEREVVLAIQDTMTLTVSTALAEALGEIGSNDQSARGVLVHSTLAVDGQTGEPIGLLDQLRWTRDDERPGRKTRGTRAYEEKESFKWELSSKAISARLATMKNVITVCDREADIHEFLQHHVERGQRFVVRAMQNRALESEEGRLWEHLEERPVLGQYEVVVRQRGGQRTRRDKGQSKRPARSERTATMTIRAVTLELRPPRDGASTNEPLLVNALLTREENCPKDATALEWMLLTSEPVGTKKAATAVLAHYERRWLIEEFHKAWKSGCRIEQRPVQSIDNLHRVAIITAQVAVRLLQLRSAATATPDLSCQHLLTADELNCLEASTKAGRSARPQPPTVLWAIQAIGRLAGWRDTKRTGRVGWDMLWKGWAILEDRVEGWRLARQASP